MIGKTISHYKIIEKIGSGGMGVVYLAKDLQLKRMVALKFLPPEMTLDRMAKERFIQEAQTASACEHQNICNIHEISETPEGQIYIVMAFYEGQTLEEIMKKRPPNPEYAADILLQIADALKEAHEQGIIHRDIKPSNIMITNKGIVKLMDFGLAKLVSHGESISQTGNLTGTTSYMSPEQILGKDIDHRADIWALGCIFYEMLTGQKPFEGEYLEAVIYLIINETPKSIDTLVDQKGARYIPIVNRCLQKESTKRYRDITEFKNDLMFARKNFGADHRPESGQKRTKHIPSRKFGYISGAMLSLFIVLMLFFSGDEFKKWVGIGSTTSEKHLVVMPFVNIGGDSTRQIFCDGLTEIITSKLTALQRFQNYLRVVPCSEVRERKISTPAEARREFGVNLVTTASIHWEKQYASMMINLIDAKDLRQLDAAVIDFNLLNPTLIREQVFQIFADMLAIELGPKDWEEIFAGETLSRDAFDYFIRARGNLTRYDQLLNIDTAIELLKKSLEKDPQYALAYAALAEAYLRKYQIKQESEWIDKATYYGNQAVNFANDLPPIHYTRGLIYKETGNYNNAIREFNSTINHDPSYSQAYSNMAECYESLGDSAMAEQTYKKSIEINPMLWDGYNMLGKFYLRHGKWEKAKSQFIQVVELLPDNIRGYNNLGAIYFYMKQYEKAQEVWERSLAINESYGACANLGTAYFYDKNYKKAIQMYEKALDYNDTRYIIWGNLAACYFWNGNTETRWRGAYERACELAEQKLMVNPVDSEIMVDLAGYYAQIDKTEQAKSLLEKAINLNPTNRSVIFRIGDVYENLGNRETALEYIKSALEKGYSLAEIETNPGLQNLIKDTRFKSILQDRQ